MIRINLISKKIFFCFFIFLFFNNYSNNTLEMYFCTASDSDFFDKLLNLIGSIHKFNFDNTKQIAVFDLGFTKEQRDLLNTLEAVKVFDVEMTNPDLLKHYIINSYNKKARGWYSWKPVIIKQALEMFPYILYLDAGCLVLNNLSNIFSYIIKNDYFLIRSNGLSIDKKPVLIKDRATKYIIETHSLNDTVLNKPLIIAGIQGINKSIYKSYIIPIYELTKNIINFEDDGSCIGGFGVYKHDQTLFSIFCAKLNLNIFECNKSYKFKIDNEHFNFIISSNIHTKPDICFHCLENLDFKQFIKFKILPI